MVVYDIIDGQQRATTICLLIYALNALKNNPQDNIKIFWMMTNHDYK